MKKILLILIMILLIIAVYFALSSGISIGNIQVLGIRQIAEANENLDKEIQELNQAIDVTFPQKMSDLETASTNFQKAKEEYLNLTNVSSDQEILDAMKQESYTIEYLWARIGNHAKKQGVNIELQIVSNDSGVEGMYNLNFTVDGSYIAITNFISAIENDGELNFRIQGFTLNPNQGNILRSTFTVRNIAIQGNTSTQTVQTTQNNTNATGNNTQNTNTNTQGSNTQTNADTSTENTNTEQAQ